MLFTSKDTEELGQLRCCKATRLYVYCATSASCVESSLFLLKECKKEANVMDCMT